MTFVQLFKACLTYNLLICFNYLINMRVIACKLTSEEFTFITFIYIYLQAFKEIIALMWYSYQWLIILI